jgi:hypothetical protein
MNPRPLTSLAHEGALLPKESVISLAGHARQLIAWVDDIDAADIRLAKYNRDIEEPDEMLPLRVFEDAAAARRAELVDGLAPLLERAPDVDSRSRVHCDLGVRGRVHRTSGI